MNKLFSSIVIMCASLGISNSYAIKQYAVSDKIISNKVLSELTELRKSGELVVKKACKYLKCTTDTYTSNKGIPNPDNGKIIGIMQNYTFSDKNRNDGKVFHKQDTYDEISPGLIFIPTCDKDQLLNILVEKHHFASIEAYNEYLKDIIRECRSILSSLYNTTTDQDHLKTARRFISSSIPEIGRGGFPISSEVDGAGNRLPPADLLDSIYIGELKKSGDYILPSKSYSFENIRLNAFEGDPTIFDEIFAAPHIWYIHNYNNLKFENCKIKNKDVAREQVRAFQEIAEDLCHLVALSLMLWYNDNPDFELILSTSEG